MKGTTIIGGGIIGLFSAYYLNQQGIQTTVIDRGDLSNNCSIGNAGLVCPSHVIPMASPGMMIKAFQTFFTRHSPIKIPFPPSPEFINWAFRFARCANRTHVLHSIPVLARMGTASQLLYKELPGNLFENDYHQDGLLMISRTEKMGKEENEMARLANNQGMEARILDPQETRAMEPTVSENIYNAVYYPGDHHLNPAVLMCRLKEFLAKAGVQFIMNAEIKGISTETVYLKTRETPNRQVEFDQLLISAGAWSNQVLGYFKTRLALQPGKGYSITTKIGNPPKFPALLIDARLSFSPLKNNQVRITTGMEFGDYSFNTNKKRLSQLFSRLQEYYPQIKLESYNQFWTGHRPCSHDGLPFIGLLPHHKNIYVATGHSMLGVTMGPITGKLIAESICHLPLSLSLDPFRIDR